MQPKVILTIEIILHATEDITKIEKSLSETLEINPEFAKAHSNLAMLSYSLKRGKETIHHLLKAVEMFEKTGDEFMINNAKSLLKDCLKEFNLTAEECQTL